MSDEKRSKRKIERTQVTFHNFENDGSTLEGEFLRIEEMMGKDGEVFNAIILKVEDAEIAISQNRVLKDYFREIEVGDIVEIEYIGKKKCKNSKYKFSDYEVSIYE